MQTTVFYARELISGQAVVAKFSTSSLRREAQILTELASPIGIPDVVDYHEHGGWHVLILEYTGVPLDVYSDVAHNIHTLGEVNDALTTYAALLVGIPYLHLSCDALNPI